LGQQFEICNYTEHALTRSSNSRAATYIEINDHNHQKTYWGAGVDANINTASIYALISAVNRMLADN
jgi:2-isopropylmalate synthase